MSGSVLQSPWIHQLFLLSQVSPCPPPSEGGCDDWLGAGKDVIVYE